MTQFSLCLFCITIRIGSTSLVWNASYSECNTNQMVLH